MEKLLQRKKMILIMGQCKMIKLFCAFLLFNFALKAQHIDVFYSPTCDDSYESRRFISGELKQDYPNLKIVEHDVFAKGEGKKMKAVGRKFKIRRLTVPLIVVENSEYVSGYICERTTGQAYRDVLNNILYTD